MNIKSEYKIIVADGSSVVIKGLESLFSETPNFTLAGVACDGITLRGLLESVEVNTLVLGLKLSNTNIRRLIKDLIVVYPKVKIITFSSFTMPKLVQDIMEFGVHAYLAKTASLPEILESIERVHKGERFIGMSVYQKNVTASVNDNSYALTPDESFILLTELTERELDIVVLLSRGFTNQDIADTLYLSKYTVETHRKNIMKKFKLKTVGQLIYVATQQGLV